MTQDFTVFSVDDQIRFSDVPYDAAVQITTRSKDANFQDADVPNLEVTIEDNDKGSAERTSNVRI